jgi:hypothetical protein
MARHRLSISPLVRSLDQPTNTKEDPSSRYYVQIINFNLVGTSIDLTECLYRATTPTNSLFRQRPAFYPATILSSTHLDDRFSLSLSLSPPVALPLTCHNRLFSLLSALFSQSLCDVRVQIKYKECAYVRMSVFTRHFTFSFFFFILTYFNIDSRKCIYLGEAHIYSKVIRG